ncbi:hypothetical protein H0H81_010656 [Sphagnurus paluster]|uniref:Transmembrane protein n=1 Tax=Sphagnurus paluster TaxID=117069 RepID=A0A9P7FV03_9AGAR|nr:hypothetical protein H0H81_010656 [Sphagnurus paluster]
MPSFRTIFLAAATAFAGLTSAIPLTGNGGAVENILPASIVNRATMDGMSFGTDTQPKLRRLEAGHGGPKMSLRSEDERRETDRSLCETIVLASAKISVIQRQMTKVTSQDKVDDNAVVKLIADVKVVLGVTLDDAKRQNGRSMEEILSLNGQVLTKVQLADLLVGFVNLVCGLLSIAAAVSAKATVDVIVSVGVVFAEILCVSFTLIDGLYVIVRPGLDTALRIAVNLKLDALVSAYHGVY